MILLYILSFTENKSRVNNNNNNNNNDDDDDDNNNNNNLCMICLVLEGFSLEKMFLFYHPQNELTTYCL